MAMNPTHVSAKAEGRNPFTRMCYICGREFGSKSIQIHEKNCIEKWDKQNAALPRDQRRTRPKPPQLVGNDGTPVGGKMTAGEYNEAAFQTFMNEGREECPNCGRGFLRDRLEIHLRSCKPGGHFAKEREKRMAAAAAASGKDPEPSTLSATPTKSRAVESLGGGKVQVMASRSLKPKTRPTTAARPASPIQPNSAAKASEMTPEAGGHRLRSFT
ncbi:uncharacterized protein EV422DRAFT_413905 [Fimicolochytrium jonesii]|uniref:uncharacterized protein n=1 Tax=Fimicolochytrium jonesii TaxID=1396493 RepID=UPI0022FDC7B6|nr:uncharacterized protein EV422DRAFT_413905 [Fimicolochytrium jonesii]KAI8822025.1 hypothetical protein EV422DRAFT_413905 [Fimicolochytrium jonesii]